MAGYECSGRILRSMDMSPERERQVKGETVSVFSAAGAAGRGLRLDRDQMLSTLGMAGIQTPVMAGYKWLMDTGLRPRKEIKQGWAWMSLTGVFAAQAARMGLQATQENNILDGERGLWRMLAMESYDESEITKGFGTEFVLPRVETKRYPGCSITHTGLVGAMNLVRDHDLDLATIARIDVTTNRRSGIEEDDQDPRTAQDMQFSVPYQVGAALTGLPRGPQWYTSAAEDARKIARKTFLGFDDECLEFWEVNHRQMSKVRITTRDGAVYETRAEDEKRLNSTEEITDKFLECASQVIGSAAAEELRALVETIDQAPNIAGLLAALRAPASVR